MTDREHKALATALLHWRMKVSDRFCRSGVVTARAIEVHKQLIHRHHAILTERE